MKYKFNVIIKSARKKLGESQVEFGKRFGVGHSSVSSWELGNSEAGYDVISFCLTKLGGKMPIIECSKCKGKGFIQL